MRSYWSCSRFGGFLRKIFGIKKQPLSATMEDWDLYKKEAEHTSPFGYWLVEEFLDSIQRVFVCAPEKFNSLLYFIGNIKNDSHVLKTRTKLGHYSDLVERIPDALMLSVIDFVEKECFWMNAVGVTLTTDPVYKYANQSYLRRKLFPIEIDDEVRAFHGIEFINFQIDCSCKTKREKERHPYNKILEAYFFAKKRYFNFDPYEESGYNEKFGGDNFSFSSTPEKREMYGKIDALEKEFDDEVSKHCTNIVKYRKYLWT